MFWPALAKGWSWLSHNQIMRYYSRVSLTCNMLSRVFCRWSSSISPLQAIGFLRQRQLLEDYTKLDESIRHVDGSSVYVGFDPTADSLHIGNLVTIMAMLHFQRAGYQPLALVGGATGIIGDPSGRTTERELLHLHTLEQNLAGISSTLERIFQNANNTSTIHKPLLGLKVVNNADWYKNMSVISFMSDIGRHFRVSSMLEKDSISKRINTEDGINFTEFSYQIFQAYDFLHLHKNYKCYVQIGGRDQWGNISSGCRFVRKSADVQVQGVTVPLITTSLGEKIGKSAGNAVWLSADKTSPYHLYQYFVNTSDQDVERFLYYFTLASSEQISSIMEAHVAAPQRYLAQKHLAEQVIRLIHGEEELQKAIKVTNALFGNKEDLARLSKEELELLFQGAPSTELVRDQHSNGIDIVDLLTETRITTSKAMATKLVTGGGIYINLTKIISATEKVCPNQHALHGQLTILRKGKKQYHLIKWI